MTIEEQYARALRESVKANPSRAKEYLANLRRALERRGHEKLLPRVLASYEKLQLREERAEAQEPSGETLRTRALLSLYRRLIATN